MNSAFMRNSILRIFVQRKNSAFSLMLAVASHVTKNIIELY